MDSVHVAIRLRPFIKRERDSDQHVNWKAEAKENVVQYSATGKPIGKPYTFDRVFDQDDTTADVYEEIAQPIVESAMNGYDGTIFAYGQTSSGKTFTMQGSQLCPGIIPSTVNEVFETIENTPDREFLLRVSYAELYNEGITDLLSHEKKQLSIRENGERVYVSNLTEEVCTSSDQILNLMRRGDARRHIGRTNMNEHSSRSHTIFCMIIESRGRRQEGDGAVKVSHLNLVDLAGSERANETKAEGARLKEACNINQSLFVLGTVINRLASGAEFVPFRDSKLTRILSSSLGGNAKTAIICTITAASIEQTQSTLQFATRAKTIKNKPVMNEIVSDEALMLRMKKEIRSLKKRLEEQAPSALTDGEKEALLSQEREKMKKEVMKEMQEKMDYFRNTVLVSKSGGTPKNILKRKPRRETWCPGMTLQPLILPPCPALLQTQISPLSSETSLQEKSPDPDPRISVSSESVSSISSSEFNYENAEAFRADVLNEGSEALIDATFPDLDMSYSKKSKRRRANVHFGEDAVYSFTPEEYNREIACQTDTMDISRVEPVESGKILEMKGELMESMKLCETLSEEKNELQCKLEEIEKETKMKADELSDITKLKGDLMESMTLCEARSKEKNELQSKLEEIEKEIKTDESSDITKLKKELTESMTLCETLSEEKNELQSKLEEIEKETKTDESSDITKLQGELLESLTLCEALSEEKNELQSKLEEFEKETKTDESSDITKLQGELLESLTLCEALSEEKNELQSKLEEVEKEMKMKTDESSDITKMQGELLESLTLCEALSEEKNELQSKLEEVEKEMKMKTDESSDITKMKGELMESFALCEALSKEKNELQSKLEEIKKETETDQSSTITKLNEEIAELKFGLLMKSEECAELKEFTRIEDKVLKGRECELLSELNNLQEILKQKDKDLKEFEMKITAQLTQSENEKQDLDFQLGVEKERHHSMTSELRHQLQEAYDRLNAKEEGEGVVGEGVLEIANRAKVVELESRLADVLQEMEAMKGKESQEEEKMTQLETLLDCALEEKRVMEEMKVPELESRLAAVLQEMEAMKEKESQEEEKIMQLETLLECALEEKRVMEETKVPELESRLAKILLDMDTLQNERSVWEENVSDLESKLASVVQEKEILREEKELKEENLINLESRFDTLIQEKEGVEKERVIELESKFASVLKEVRALKDEKNLKEDKITEMESLLKAKEETEGITGEGVSEMENRQKVVNLESRLADVLHELEAMKEKERMEQEKMTQLETLLDCTLEEKMVLEETKVPELESRLAKILLDMEALQKEGSVWEENVSDLEAKLASVVQEKDILREEKELKEEKLMDLESRFDTIIQEKEGVDKERVTELEFKFASVLQEVEALKDEKNLKEDKITELESLLNAKEETEGITGEGILEMENREKVADLESRLADVLQEMEAMKEKERRGEEKMTQLETLLECALKEKKVIEETKVPELESRLAKILLDMETLQKEGSVWEENVSDLEAKLASVVQEKEILRQEKELKEEKLVNLESRYDTLILEKEGVDKERVIELESKLASVVQEYEILREEKELKEEKLKNLESRFDTLIQEKDGVDKERVIELESKLASVVQEYEILREEKDIKEEKLRNLESRFDTLIQEKEGVDKERVIELEPKIASLLQEVEALKEEKNLKEDKITELELLLASFPEEDKESIDKNKIIELESHLTKVLQELDALKEEKTMREEKVAQLETWLSTGMHEIESLREEKTMREAQMAELESTLASASQEQNAAREVAEVELQLASVQQELEALKEEKITRIDQISELETRLTNFSQEQDALQDEKVTELESRLSGILQEMDALEEEKKLSAGRAVEQEIRLGEVLRDVERLQNELLRITNEKTRLAAENCEMMSQVHLREASENRLEGVCEELRTALQESEREKQRLETSLRSANDKQVQIDQDCEQRWQGECEELRRACQESVREKERLESALRSAAEKQESLEKEVKKRKEDLKRVRHEAFKDDVEWQKRIDELCEELEGELEAEQAKVKSVQQKLSEFEVLCKELQVELKAKNEEIDSIKEDRRDIFNKKEMLEKQHSKTKKQLNEAARSSIRDVSEAETRANAVCAELEEEVEAEKAKVKEAQDKVESQARQICELEAQLTSKVMQSKGGDTNTRSLETELSAMKREMTVLEMEHTRQIIKLEDRISDLEGEKKFLDEKNREYRNELRRERQRTADSSVLSYGNYTEAGVCGSGASYDVSLYSLRAENEAIGRNLKLTQTKYETAKTQRDSEVEKNKKLKKEVVYWNGKYNTLKSKAESKTQETRQAQPLTEVNTEHPGVLSDASEDAVGDGLTPDGIPYQANLQERMFKLFEGKKEEKDEMNECKTQ